METSNEFQPLFSQQIKANSIIQLKNGRILFYYFLDEHYICIYNETTFQKILEIDLYKPIEEYEIKNQENELNSSKDNYKDFHHYLRTNSPEEKFKNYIKELNNGLILIGYFKYLIELNLQEKTYYIKVVYDLVYNILDIIELSDNRILIILESI